MGICPIREELYGQCFEEVIRQVTISCAERGLLLLRLRGQLQMTLAAYKVHGQLYITEVLLCLHKYNQSRIPERIR